MDNLRKAYRITVIIGLAMMASLVIFLIVVSVLPQSGVVPDGQNKPVTESDVVFYICLAISVLIFLLIRSVGSVILNGRGTAGAPLIQRLQTAAIITFALSEVPAILGLVLFFLGRSRTDFHIFLLFSLFLFTIYFPKFSQWEEWYRQQTRTGK